MINFTKKKTTTHWLRRSFKILLVSANLLLGWSQAQAQLTVTVTNGGNTTPNLASSYSSLASAITDLNAVTAFSGPVTLTCSGTSETAPAGGFLIAYTAATSATNNIVIDGSSTTLRAASIATAGGAATGQADAVIKIVGSDYLTIQNFTITENSSNTVEGALAAQKMTEFGIALFAASATNGAQNNTIQNNIITMSNGSTTYRNAIGIFSSTTAAYSAPATARAATSIAGTNSNNKIYGNTISGVAHGIYFVAPPQTATVFESGIDIGGTSALTGNNITFGVSNTASDLTWTSYSSSAVAGIYFRNGVLGFNVQYNTIINKSGLTQSSGGMYNTVGTAPTGVATAHTSTFSNNIVTITQTSTASIYGVDFGGGLTNTSMECNNNTVTINHTSIAANSASDYLIKAGYASANANFNNNIMTYNGFTNSRTASITNSGTIYGLYLPGGTTGSPTTNALNNTINLNKTDSMATSWTSTFSGSTYGIYMANAATTMNIGSATANTGNTININDSIVSGGGTAAFSYTGYAIYNAAGSGNLSLINNTITTGRSGKCRTTSTQYGFYYSTAITSGFNVSNNTIYFDRSGIVTGAGTTYACYLSGAHGTLSNGYAVNNNSITILGPTTSGSCYGFYAFDGSSAGTKSYTNNTINISGSPSLIYGIYTYNGGITIANNNFNITTSYASSPTVYGIYQGSTWATGDVYSNTFNNISATGTGTSAPTINAIYMASTTTGTLNIRDNIVTNMSAAGSSGAAVLTGIYLTTGGLTSNVYRNKVYNLNNNSTSATSATYLIRVTSGQANGTANIYNNLISQTSALTGFNNPVGINAIYSTSAIATFTMNVYYNTIYLSSTSTGANFGGYGIFHTTNATATTSALNLRNNIIVNIITPTGTGTSYAYKRSSTALNNFSSSSNNNLLYCATGIFNDGTNTDLTIGDYKTRVSPREGSSVSENLSWLNNSNPTGANYLKLNPATATQVESGAISISGYNDDYNTVGSRASFPLSGQTNGGGTAPDMGAQEMDLTPADLTGPSISFSSAPNTINTAAVTLTATITDASGVPTSGAGLPVLYWRLGNSGTFSSIIATWVSGNTYSFTFGGGNVNDQIQYYIAAQDNASVPNVSISPSAGASGNSINPPACSTSPTTPARYTILSTWAGTYVIGGNGAGPAAGADYVSIGEAIADVTPGQIKSIYLSNGGSGYATAPTITFTGGGGSGAAATAYVTSGVITRIVVTSTGSNYSSAPTVVITSATGTGAIATANVSAGKVMGAPVTLSLSSNYDGTLYEGIFPITIGELGQSATNTLTIKPAAGVATTISGTSATAIFDLNGADYTTIDGSNSGTSSKNLTVINNSTTANSTVIKVTSLGLGAGATNNTIKNMNLSNGSSSVVNFGVFVGGSSIISSGADNDNVTIENNNIVNIVTAIYAYGTTSVSAGANDNLIVRNNSILINSTTTPMGIQVGYGLNGIISGNTVDIFTTASTQPSAISIETGFLNCVVEKNKITRVATSATGGYGGRGITVGTGVTGSNVTIRNNVIFGMNGSNYTSFSNSSSMGIGVGIVGNSTTITTVAGGVNIYNNSINLYGDYTYAAATLTADIYVGSAATGLDIRNNVLKNSMNNINASGTGAKNYCVYSAATISAFTTINYNDYYTSGTQGVLGFITSDRTNLAGMQTGFGGNVNSINVDPQYNNNTTLLPQIGAPVLAVGTPISGLTTDLVGATRSLTAPSMGAYENGGDGTAPTITYTNLNNLQASSSRTLTATIQDLGLNATGVDTTVFVPVIYFKKSTDGNTFGGNTSADNGWKHSASASTSTPFSLTMDFSLLRSALVQGDVIQYFVVAQDYAGNLAGSPSLALDGSNVNTIITAPVSPNSYTVLGPPITAGTYTIGTTVPSTYPTITAAALDFSLRGIAGTVVYELVDPAYNTTTGESFPIVFGNTSGTSSSSTITIRPISGNNGVVITSANATATFDLNGSQYLTFDGRPGGTGSFVSGTNLIISNTTATAPAFRLINEASNNNILYCDLQANNTTATSATTGGGVVCIGSTTGTNGNDNNTISYCDIHNATGGNPIMGVYGYGSATTIAANNDSNYVTNCNIYDFFSAGTATAGVYIGSNNGYWRINNNHFYQTATRTLTGAVVHRAIWCTPNTGSLTSASGFILNNNFIGGNSAAGTGMYTTTSTVASSFLGIDASVGQGAYTEIQNNTIANINQTSANTGSATLVGIKVANGNVNVGTTTGNTIGSTTTNSSIILNTSVAGGGFMGIQTTAGPNINISNNHISGIELVGTVSTAACEFFGLALSGGNNMSVTNNVIGDASLANSINSSSSASTSTFAQRIHGMIVNPLAGTPVYTISNNLIANINTNYSATGTQATSLKGIAMLAAFAGTYNITNNTIRNLSSATKTTSSGIDGGVVGIGVSTTTASSNSNVTGNTVHTLILSNTGTDAQKLNGIYFTGATTGTYAINKNFVHSLRAGNSNTLINGISIGSTGSLTISNNMVRLGIDENGNSITTATGLRGIQLSSSTGNINLYFNTVLVSGTNVGPDSNSTYSLYCLSSSGTKVIRNNIFSNTRQNGSSIGNHYAMYASSNTGLNMNNNNYYTIGSPLAYYNTTTVADLSGWRTTVAQDANSMVEAPVFVSPNGTNSTVDLHIVPATQSLMESGGSNISGLTTDFDGDSRPGPVGSLNGGGLSSDIGADEFDGSMFPINMGAQVLVSPVGSCAISGKTVTIRIKNYSLTQAINFAINNLTLSSSVAGPNPTSFTPIVLNSGTLAIGATQDVVVTTNYDMSNIGTYTFDASTSVLGDANTSNDAMPSATVVISGLTPGTVTANETSFCRLTGPPTFTTTATGGDIQWIYSTVGKTGPWTNVGTNSATYTPASIISTSTYFMATVSCNSSSISAGDTVGIIVPQILSTTPGSICGTGAVNLSATGAPGNILNWYSASTGGVKVGTGSTFTTPNLTSTTNYYVAASSNGGSTGYVGEVNIKSTAGTGGGLTTYVTFDAISDFTLQTVDIFPYGATNGVAGTVTIELRTATGTPIMSQLVNVTASNSVNGSAQRVTLNFPVTGGASYRLGVNSWTGGVTNLYRDLTGTYPYTIPGTVSITGTSLSPYYYFFYNWGVSTGCESARQLVTATVNSAPALTLSAVNANICSGSSSTSVVNITSNVNDFDTYNWTPSTGVSGSAATGFTFSPSVATSYVLNASQSAGQQCINSANLSVTLNPLTQGTVSSSDAQYCGITGKPTLTTTATGGNYQWYESTISRNGPWTAVGINASSYTPSSNISSTTYYRATLTCNSSAIEAGDTVSVLVPTIVSSTNGSRCGAGTVTLGATAGQGGNVLNWYTTSAGGTPIATGNSFVTPSISTTTNYYVAASTNGGSTTNIGPATISGSTTVVGTYYMNFTVTSAVTIASVKCYFNAVGSSYLLNIRDASSLASVFTYAGTTTVSGTATPQLIPINATLAPGNYQMGWTTDPGTYRQSTGASYPYSLPGVISITGNTFNDPNYFYYFYDWSIVTGCESTRQLVTATVNTLPSAPSTPTTVSKTASSINVSWPSVSGATGYQLDVATNAGFTSMVSGYSNLSVSGNTKSITGLASTSTYYIRVRAVNATSCVSANSSTLTETTPSSSISVALTAYLQGMYTGTGTMTAAPFNADGVTSNTIADTINVELHDITGALAYTTVGTLSTSGIANVTFPGSTIGHAYYIVIKHRNSIATSTADTVSFLANGTSYNFSTSVTKAYGANMLDDGNGIFMIYTGDINQDGSVDFNDYPDLDISSSNGDLGYLPFDLNGDASVDFNDYPMIDVNSSNGIIAMLPY